MIRQVHLYKRILVFFLTTFLLIALALTGLYKKPTQWIGSLVGELIYTIQEGTLTTVSAFRGFFPRSLFSGGLDKENALLKKEIEQLHGEINRLKEEEARALRLSRLLAFTQASPLKFIAANVIGRETGPWLNTLMIDKGTSSGISVYMGVVTPRGVVGRVIKTFSRGAQVLLMTDANSAIAGMVQRTRDEGMVHGIGRDSARLKYLPRVSEVAEGDLLITSGLEGSFPKGLLIGRVQKIQRQGTGFFLDVTVTPEIAFSKLEEVLVLASLRETPQETTGSTTVTTLPTN